MKVLFLGLGGAGQRHLRIIKNLIPKVEIYALRFKKKTPLLNNKFQKIGSKNSINKKYKINLLQNLKNLKKYKFSFAVLALPTSMHSKYSKIILKNKINLLCEKPGFINSEEFKLIKRNIKKNKYLVSFQREFHPLVLQLKKKIFFYKKKNIRYIYVKCYSNLKKWHPYEKYYDLYAAKKKSGGGVIKTECHEIFFIINLFGFPKKIKFIKKCENKKYFDVETKANLIFFYKNFSVFFDINFLKNKNERSMQFFYLNKTITLDLITEKLCQIENNKKILYKKKFSNNNLFKAQLKYFLKNKKFLNHINSLKNLSKIFSYTS